MATKKYKSMADLTQEELVSKRRESEADLFKKKMEHKAGSLENTGALKVIRKDIARMNFLLGQKAKAKTQQAEGTK